MDQPVLKTPTSVDFIGHFVVHLIEIRPFSTKCVTKCAIKGR
jgi:hypothetical protein